MLLSVVDCNWSLHFILSSGDASLVDKKYAKTLIAKAMEILDDLVFFVFLWHLWPLQKTSNLYKDFGRGDFDMLECCDQLATSKELGSNTGLSEH